MALMCSPAQLQPERQQRATSGSSLTRTYGFDNGGRLGSLTAFTVHRTNPAGIHAPCILVVKGIPHGETNNFSQPK